jgi:hypothetical protein
MLRYRLECLISMTVVRGGVRRQDATGPPSEKTARGSEGQEARPRRPRRRRRRRRHRPGGARPGGTALYSGHRVATTSYTLSH